MERLQSYASIMAAVCIGILLQIILVWADCGQTPAKAAENFAKAYYQLDPSMGEYLCLKTSAANEGKVVETYIRRVTAEAADRGLDPNTLKYVLSHIETFTRRIDDATAEVRITAKQRVSINPVYAQVARLFRMGETHTVDELVTVVQENGRWKVCGSPFSLTS